MADIFGKVNTLPTYIFPCTQCGLCCQNVHRSNETLFLDRGDGTCRYYDSASKACSIYTDRPEICRVDQMYTLRYAHLYTWDEFVALNQNVCEHLQLLSEQAPSNDKRSS